MNRLAAAQARHEFLQRAAFLLLREGHTALTMRGLARTLGTTEASVRRALRSGTRLPVLAQAEVLRRRGRRPMPHPVDAEGTERAVRALLPTDEAEVDVEVVALRVMLALAAPRGSARSSTEGLHNEYAVALGRPADEQPDQAPPEPVDPDPQVVAASRAWSEHRGRTLLALRRRTRTVGATDPLDDLRIATALVDGLALAVATSRLDPEEAGGLLVGLLDHAPTSLTA